jgi:hypothetical protein
VVEEGGDVTVAARKTVFEVRPELFDRQTISDKSNAELLEISTVFSDFSSVPLSPNLKTFPSIHPCSCPTHSHHSRTQPQPHPLLLRYPNILMKTSCFFTTQPNPFKPPQQLLATPQSLSCLFSYFPSCETFLNSLKI